jgi:hypothetical protein
MAHNAVVLTQWRRGVMAKTFYFFIGMMVAVLCMMHAAPGFRVSKARNLEFKNLLEMHWQTGQYQRLCQMDWTNDI